MTVKTLVTAFGIAAVLGLGGGAEAQAQEAGDMKKTTSTGDYTYTAQPGDSYSAMARKAVQTYGINTKTKLSLAQILYTEAGLTVEAGSPYLEVGQKVTIAKKQVMDWVEKAKKLSASERAAWATYVPWVDFNTNAVGQAPKTN